MRFNVKPCPFCGGDARFILFTKPDETFNISIRCSNCRCMISPVRAWHDFTDSLNDLVSRWNSREEKSEPTVEDAINRFLMED